MGWKIGKSNSFFNIHLLPFFTYPTISSLPISFPLANGAPTNSSHRMTARQLCLLTAAQGGTSSSQPQLQYLSNIKPRAGKVQARLMVTTESRKVRMCNLEARKKPDFPLKTPDSSPKKTDLKTLNFLWKHLIFSWKNDFSENLNLLVWTFTHPFHFYSDLDFSWIQIQTTFGILEFYLENPFPADLKNPYIFSSLL